MEVVIDREGCISCGLCVSTCEDVFQFADDGKAEVIKQPEGESEQALAREAAEGCPVAVIGVE